MIPCLQIFCCDSFVSLVDTTDKTEALTLLAHLAMCICRAVIHELRPYRVVPDNSIASCKFGLRTLTLSNARV